MEEIIELDIKNYEKCNNIWNMEKNKELKDRFYKELKLEIERHLSILKLKNTS